jgi:hypothetical protein
MKPAIVFPFHDSEGVMFPHLKTITPLLKQIFSEAYLSITPITAARFPENIEFLEKDKFFNYYLFKHELPVGKQFKLLYEFAAQSCSIEKILHICFVDRLIFALKTRHGKQFVKDVASLNMGFAPIIFQRSEKAWASYPRNYYEVEKFVTTIGELVFGQKLDFAWCHLAICSTHLAEILPSVQGDDMSMMADIILLVRDKIRTQDVDWLEWEDPFFSSVGVKELKRIREESIHETQKRLSYTIPMVDKILAHRNE